MMGLGEIKEEIVEVLKDFCVYGVIMLIFG